MDAWERCGNTTFYRRPWRHDGNPLAWYYVDPFNWTYITSAPSDGPAGDEGVTSVIWRRAPSYALAPLRVGVGIVSEDLNVQADVLKHMRGWGADVERAKEMKLSKNDLRKNFESAPVQARNNVLNGVRALILGWQYQAMINKEDSPVEERVILVVEWDSPTELLRLPDIEKSFPNWKSTVVVDDPIKGLEDALSEFGIHEC